MNNSENEVIIQDDPKWKEKILNYSMNKKYPLWEINKSTPDIKVYPQKITHQMINERQQIFNPITQEYHDKEYDKSLRAKENTDLINTISKNYDHSLRKEQTYNIINLNNKLEPLGYKDNTGINIKIKQNKEVSHAPYNIISNLSLKDHHYNPPDKRGEYIPLELLDHNNNIITKEKTPISHNRDFNIINNRYFRYNDEKVEAEKEIEKLTSAKHFLQNQDYDIIKGRYYDDDREKEYQEKRKKIEAEWSSNHKDPNHLIINPVNNFVYDKERQDEIDKKEYNRIQRYRLKNDMDFYYHNRDYNQELQTEAKKDNHISYFNFKTSDLRGYDIINMKNTYAKYRDKINENKQQVKNIKSDWDLLKEGINSNGTFGKKQIFKDKYDTSDIDEDRYHYNIKRKKMLEELPLLTEDNRFNNIETIPKKRKIFKIKEDDPTKVIFNKEKWFKGGSKDYYGGKGIEKRIDGNERFDINGNYGRNAINWKKYRERMALSTEF